MHTLNLEQAAEFLHMHPAVVRQRAKLGLIRASKPGKRWVFLESDLVDYLRSFYIGRGQTPLSDCEQENSLCHSLNAAIPTGSASRPRTASVYANLLGLPTSD